MVKTNDNRCVENRNRNRPVSDLLALVCQRGGATVIGQLVNKRLKRGHLLWQPRAKGLEQSEWLLRWRLLKLNAKCLNALSIRRLSEPNRKRTRVLMNDSVRSNKCREKLP